MTNIAIEFRPGTNGAHAVWHPTPEGDHKLWYWTGEEWIDPIAEIEAQIAEMIVPHLEKTYAEGFVDGHAIGLAAGWKPQS